MLGHLLSIESMTNSAYAKTVLNYSVVPASVFHAQGRLFDSQLGLHFSQRSLPKVIGFLRLLRFPPTRNVDRVGMGEYLARASLSR